MRNRSVMYCLYFVTSTAIISGCTANNKENSNANPESGNSDFHGFSSQVAWGEHLVQISGCNDCHTPKRMSPMGPVDDTTLLLSGHPEKLPPPEVDRKDIEGKGLAVTRTMTAWVGPWGISYSANLTSDESGIGNWQESNFITAIREGKYKGIPGSRTLLPPMPWQWYRHMTDDELKAIFAYLKSTKPIRNVVPSTTPPVTAMR
jgi:hypothetical protein